MQNIYHPNPSPNITTPYAPVPFSAPLSSLNSATTHLVLAINPCGPQTATPVSPLASRRFRSTTARISGRPDDTQTGLDSDPLLQVQAATSEDVELEMEMESAFSSSSESLVSVGSIAVEEG